MIDFQGNLSTSRFFWLFGDIQGGGTANCRDLRLLDIDGTRHWRQATIVASEADWSGGDIDASDGATLILMGEFDLLSDRVWATSSGTSTVDNRGPLIKQTKGTTTFSANFKNTGDILVLSGRIHFTKLTQDGGSLYPDEGASIQADSAMINAGKLEGRGTISGKIENNTGKASPGKSPGILTIDGSYTQQAGAGLEIELAGLTPGDAYDRLDVLGPAKLGGSLNVTLLNGFVPSLGDRFEVMRFASRDGAFAVNNGLRVGTNRLLIPIYSATNLVLVVTDSTLVTPSLDASFNSSGAIKLSWETTLGRSYQLQASSNLLDWMVLTNASGTGSLLDFMIPVDRSTPRQYFRLRYIIYRLPLFRCGLETGVRHPSGKEY